MLQAVGGGRRRRWPKGTWMKLRSAEVLRAEMRHRGLSERTLARYAGCSRAFIGHLLHERKSSCTPELAVRIEEALGLREGALFVPRVSSQTEHKSPGRAA
jgi:transcriptional regulator with XRE-family HTH domain